MRLIAASQRPKAEEQQVKKTNKKTSAKAADKKPSAIVKRMLESAKQGAKRVEVEKPKTISAVARSMILEGSTNEQVLEALQKLFNVDVDSKRHYPGWYRAQLVRQGKMDRGTAAATRH
jgi:hypothetical protein